LNAITPQMVRKAFNGEESMNPSSLAKKINSLFKVGNSTVYRAIDENGYLANMFQRDAKGLLRLNGEEA